MGRAPRARGAGRFSTTEKGGPPPYTRDKELFMLTTGLDALLRQEDSVLALVDHQSFQFATLHSHEPTLIMNKVVGLAKAAKLFGVPTIVSAVLQGRGGDLSPRALRQIFPAKAKRSHSYSDVVE